MTNNITDVAISAMRGSHWLVDNLKGDSFYVVDKFWHIYAWVESTSGTLPKMIPTGFFMTYAGTLVLLPVILYVVLRMIWSLADVGCARKSMTTFFVVIIGIPLYPILTALILSILWLVIGVVSIVLVTIGPVAFVAASANGLMILMQDVTEKQRKKMKKLNKRHQKAEDITCFELCWGLCIGIVSLCTFGVGTLVVTVLKGPLVLLSYLLRSIYWSVRWWLTTTHSPCLCCYQEGSYAEAVVEVQAFLAVEVDGVECLISELKADGYSAEELRDLGVGCSNLKAVGFTLRELKAAGFSDHELRGAGFSASDVALVSQEKCDLCLWCWFPIIFPVWLIALALGFCVVTLGIFLSAIAKLIAATIWPAYVAAGWLRIFAQGRRRDNACCTPCVQGMKAGYQVLWAADLFTNACIMNRLDLFSDTAEELRRIVTGRQDDLSPAFRAISWLPFVKVGLFEETWDLRVKLIAEKLGVSENEVTEAWRALARQMIRLGREAVDEGVLTEDWVSEVPAELCLGLPARALLETVERSAPGEMLLHSGLRLTPDHFGTHFASKIWENFQAAQLARSRLQLQERHRSLLCAALLAGGGDPEALPLGLAQAVREYEKMPRNLHECCQKVLSPLLAISIECSRQEAFKDKLQLVVEGVTSSESAAFVFVTSPELDPANAKEDSLSSASSDSDSDL